MKELFVAMVKNISSSKCSVMPLLSQEQLLFPETAAVATDCQSH